MSAEPAEDKVKMTNGSEEPQAGASDADTGDHPRVKKKRLGVDPSLIISDGRSKRRKTPDETPEMEVKKEQGLDRDPKDAEKAAQVGRELYQKLVATTDKEGEELALPFMKLPNKRSFPDYYETIKHPMCLDTVDKKLKAKEYETLKDVVADLGQIFNNAKRYNTKESVLFQWAKRLHKITRTFYANITNPGEAEPDSDHEDGPTAGASSVPPDVSMEVEEEGDGRGASESMDDGAAAGKQKRGGYMREGPTVYKLIKPVLKAIKEAKSLDGQEREIAGIFMDLPDRKDLPDYYKVITQPVSLQEIEDRMMGRKYETWEEFFADVELMCTNAFTYNEDDSEVFQDAKQIKNILEYYRNEIRTRLSQPQITKFKIQPPTASPARVHSVEPPRPVPLPQAPGHVPQPPIPSQQPQQPSQHRPNAPYLPALPKGVVTEEVVASLERYPLYEQQAWAQSLPPVSMQIYRQIQAGNEARRRIAENRAAGPGANSTPPQLADLPSSGRPGGSRPAANRPAPPLPTIRCIDFSFASSPSTGAPSSQPASAIRLHNMRGVVTHAVVVGSRTSEIELTAYIADPPTRTTNGEVSPAHFEDVPEVSLRINGNQGNLPRFIFAGDQKDKPAGMRWVVSVPPARADTKIEIRATKPGALAETSSIYINRQM